MVRGMAATSARARRRWARAGALSCVLALAPARGIRAEPATGTAEATLPATGAGESRGKLARLDPSPVDVAGRIVSSSRGRGGPVRLEIEGADGKRLPALLPDDEVLDRLGLSLRRGETVVLRGSMFPGARPALVATAVVVDGRPVPIRDARGAGPTAARAASERPGSTAAGSPAAPSR